MVDNHDADQHHLNAIAFFATDEQIKADRAWLKMSLFPYRYSSLKTLHLLPQPPRSGMSFMEAQNRLAAFKLGYGGKSSFSTAWLNRLAENYNAAANHKPKLTKIAEAIQQIYGGKHETHTRRIP